jgi:hypothetical protein
MLFSGRARLTYQFGQAANLHAKYSKNLWQCAAIQLAIDRGDADAGRALSFTIGEAVE